MSAFNDPNYFADTTYTYPFDPNHLAPSQEYLAQPRHSISSSTSDIFPHLSPAPPSLHHTSGSGSQHSRSQSPRSSASPHSTQWDTSISEFDLQSLLDNEINLQGIMAYNATGIPMEYDQKPNIGMDGLVMPQNLFLPTSGFGTMGNDGFNYGKMQEDQLANMLFQQQEQQQQQQHTMAPEWLQEQQLSLREHPQFPQAQPPQNLFDFQNAVPLPTSASPPISATKPKAAAKAVARRGPKPKEKDGDENAPLGPSGGKHNKTERRYRQKVQAAQSELRDSVPALRVLYGTSTDEQKQTTDIKLADGSVDGLGEITRPNASAKTTIFVGAKLYIELLQERVAGLQRQVEELENYRSAVGGQEDLDMWKADFEEREKRHRQLKEAADRLKRAEDSEEDGEDDDEEEEEVVVKKKKARKTPVKKDDNTASTAFRTFAAFAMTFSFLPSAGDTFTSIPLESGLPMSNPTTGQVISRLPIITAEHAVRLLGRGLPATSVPHPTTLVEWGWRILVAVTVAAILGPIFRRLSKMTQAGLMTTIKEAVKLAFRVEGKTNPVTRQYAAAIAGGSTSPSRMSFLYTILHLNRTCADSSTLALLALLQPTSSFLAPAETLWKQARASIDERTPASLISVLDIPLQDALEYLSILPATSDPLREIGNQLSLVRLNDLYIRLFIKLVSSSVPEGPLPTSTKALLENLDNSKVGLDLRSSLFDQEIKTTIQSVEKGTTAHALSLVLVGLWGVFTGPTPSSQAALVSALAAEEMSGQSNLGSVPAMLNLLYPGSASMTPQLQTDRNALAIDRLALVCIEYIQLLLSSRVKKERMEASKYIQRVTTNLRLAITQTEFIGLNGVKEVDSGYMGAKERLVGVLSALSRRSRGRVMSKDIDSGLDPEIDEL